MENKETNHIGESNEMVTAVEWMAEKVGHNSLMSLADYNEILEQALAMEKEQIINALGVGCQIKPTGLIGYYEMGEQYYEETYKK
jgi:hypothetical protein